MDLKTKWAVLAVGLAMAVGCENPVERCNLAKVAASDAWRPVETAVKDPCSLFADRHWDKVEREGMNGLRGLASGAASSSEAEALSVSLCADRYRPALKASCRGAVTAHASAALGAIAARDAALDADKALVALPTAASAFAACVQGLKLEEYVAMRDIAQQHAASVTGSAIDALRKKAQAVSAEAFERCQRVSP